MKHSTPTVLAFAWVLAQLLAVSGCAFDPWPEPDPDETSGGDYDEGGTDSDTGGQEPDDSNDTEGDEDGEADDESLTDATAVFSSAPNPDGVVTIVGIPGAAEGSAVLVSGQSGQTEAFVLSDDGSFAGRIEAAEGEILSVTVLGEEGPDAPIFVAAGTLEWGAVGDSIVGPGAGAGAPNDAGDSISIQGEGDALQLGLVVIAGNVDLSAGQSAAITCAAACQFDLVIPGAAGDEIDLFLVRDGENSGVTDSQTEVVPE